MANNNLKKNRPASSKTLKNDRNNFLINIENDIHYIIQLRNRVTSHNNFTINDALSLRDVIIKSFKTTKKYFSPRPNLKDRDQMIERINTQLPITLVTSNLTNEEIRWLSKFSGVIPEDISTRLSQSLLISKIYSIKELLLQIDNYNNQVHSLTLNEIQNDYLNFLDKALIIAIGVGLLCHDGLRFYSSILSNFSVESIQHGSSLFLHQIELD